MQRSCARKSRLPTPATLRGQPASGAPRSRGPACQAMLDHPRAHASLRRRRRLERGALSYPAVHVRSVVERSACTWEEAGPRLLTRGTPTRWARSRTASSLLRGGQPHGKRKHSELVRTDAGRHGRRWSVRCRSVWPASAAVPAQRAVCDHAARKSMLRYIPCHLRGRPDGAAQSCGLRTDILVWGVRRLATHSGTVPGVDQRRKRQLAPGHDGHQHRHLHERLQRACEPVHPAAAVHLCRLAAGHPCMPAYVLVWRTHVCRSWR